MAKTEWAPGNMLYPVPAVLVTSRSDDGKDNVCTVAWTGTINSDPPMVSISLRKSRLSYDNIRKSGVFAINITTESLAFAVDLCGVKSGRDEDKFKTAHLVKEKAAHIDCCMIAQSPVNLECRVKKSRDLGSHTVFLAEIIAVHVDDKFIDEKKKFRFNDSKPLVYVHGEYHGIGRYIGKFGYSVEKKKPGPVKKGKA